MIKAGINLMKEKPEHKGHIFLMDGAGSNGMATVLFTSYGASKAAYPQLQNTIASALKQHKVNNVFFHLCSPGMVITDLLTSQMTAQNKKIFNILAERPETVADWLAPRIRAVAGNSKFRPGKSFYIRYLTMPGAIWRFMTAFTRKNRFFVAQ